MVDNEVDKGDKVESAIPGEQGEKKDTSTCLAYNSESTNNLKSILATDGYIDTSNNYVW